MSMPSPLLTSNRNSSICVFRSISVRRRSSSKAPSRRSTSASRCCSASRWFFRSFRSGSNLNENFFTGACSRAARLPRQDNPHLGELRQSGHGRRELHQFLHPLPQEFLRLVAHPDGGVHQQTRSALISADGDQVLILLIGGQKLLEAVGAPAVLVGGYVGHRAADARQDVDGRPMRLLRQFAREHDVAVQNAPHCI